MTAGDEIHPETQSAGDAVSQESLPVTEVRRASRGTPWSRGIRLAKIQSGRFVHSVVMSLRERLPSKVAAAKNGIAILKRAAETVFRYAKSHRKLSAVAGCLLIAAVAFAWKYPHNTPEEPAAERPGLVLDDVKVFPPQEGRDSRPSDSTDDRQRASEPGRFPQGDSRFAAGPQFPNVAATKGPELSTPMPPTPRAVWLLGTIEDADQAESRVQSAGHVELPYTSRQTGMSNVPRVLSHR
jgi:hypothetical protein